MTTAAKEASANAAPTVSPLLAPWTGAHGGLPPLDRVRVEEFEPALLEGMRAYRQDLEHIVNTREAATFANTIERLEDAGRAYKRVMTFYGIWSSAMAEPAFQAVEERMAPKLAAFDDEIVQNRALFDRIDAVYASAQSASSALTPEQKRLTWVVWNAYVRAGAKLDAAAKAKLSEINQALASLYTKFSQNLLADEGTAITLEDPRDLEGLPEGVVEAAKSDAEARGLSGKWVVLNTRSYVEPVLTFSARRALRERVWRAFVERGDHAGEHDNKPLITRILALRAERAALLGFATHAHWRLADSMAGTPERAMALMTAMWKPAVARVRQEVADMQAVADKEGQGVEIAPWDYRFYQEKVRKARFDLDQGEIKPYLQLDRLRDGMFWMAGQLYGLAFKPVTGVPVNHPDVAVWEVTGRGGEHVGLWYFDPYARPGKQSGAWMNAYREQERFARPVTTIVSNNSNFVKPPAGKPVLVSWDDARTLFHEFGHALHGLLSNVRYPTLSGTNVARDYVEFPSQLHEAWLGTPEVLQRFALHAETGKPIPPALVERIEKASTFNQGFATVEFLSSALIDMKLHLAGATPIDPAAFERDTLAALGMPPEIVMRHRTPQFGHVFSGDGYSAGYYSYLWADAITADCVEAFKEAGSMWHAPTAKRLVETVLSVGNTVDPAEGFRALRGRDVDTDALMRARGFPVSPPGQ